MLRAAIQNRLAKAAIALRRTCADPRLDRWRADPATLMSDAGYAPDPWQVEILRSDERRVLMLAARQVGKSSATALLALKTAILTPGTTTTVVAPAEVQANELLRKTATAYHALGCPLGRAIGYAATRLRLPNGSRVVALPGKESRMRSCSSSLLIIDEAARVLDGVFNAAGPTLAARGGRLVALSTAFAKSGWFYQQWQDTQEPYLRLSIRADQCPRIPAELLKGERRRLGAKWYAMEFENVFGDDIAAVFATEDIRRAVSAEVAPLFPGLPVRGDADVNPCS